jgi:hypothetical protein
MRGTTADIHDEDESGSARDQGTGSALSDGWDIGGPLGFGTDSSPQPADMSFDFEGFGSSSSSLSLDDFEGEAAPTPAQTAAADELFPSRAQEDDSWRIRRGDGNRGRRKKNIILLATSLACLGLLAALAVPAYRAMSPSKPALVGKASVRHSVVVPEFQEGLDFLVLATSEQDKNLLSMRLEFVFPASNAHEEFSAKATFYRETVYQYLLRARPAKNSQKLWQGILEKQLTEYIKQKFPRNGLQSIRVAHWERM